MSRHPDIAAVVIGRNEGARLIRCLAALKGQAGRIVYVDSGSRDGSQQAARAAGAEIVTLDMSQPFTAARARNAGIDQTRQTGTAPRYIQFLDGDCEMRTGWLDTAKAFLETHPDVAVVCGRRRERAPEASLYNALIDREWNTPTGEAKACGGDALFRADALEAVGGYNPLLIAGEEPELCVRLRQAGWRVWRLDAEMTWHDAALTRFSQWWRRAKRGGFAFAEGAALHGSPPERHFVAETRKAAIWGGLLPGVVLLLAVLVTPWALALAVIWPLQILRLRWRGEPWASALFLTLSKFPEAQGALQYLWRRLTGGRVALIEYK
ncbi:glycosyltransferase family 2 protein [Roseobacter weihaiensis]|uniref:glycosyltransferase family 2 protein n=1 Tax=Roseobacter weihaiensis TaxID=2763262 RepID=UPI001D09A956|nr:glycosyltransferase [Roseobacter sp. H9]